MSNNEHWHDKEVADIDFGDKRLNQSPPSERWRFGITAKAAY